MVTFLAETEPYSHIIPEFYIVYKRREYIVVCDETLLEELKLIPTKGFIPTFSDIKPYLEAIGETWQFIGKGIKL